MLALPIENAIKNKLIVSGLLNELTSHFNKNITKNSFLKLFKENNNYNDNYESSLPDYNDQSQISQQYTKSSQRPNIRSAPSTSRQINNNNSYPDEDNNNINQRNNNNNNGTIIRNNNTNNNNYSIDDAPLSNKQVHF